MLSEGFLRKVICSLKVKLIYKLIGNSLNNVEWIVRKRNILLALPVEYPLLDTS